MKPPPEEAPRRRRHLPPLPLGIRIVLLVLGWGLILLGIAGLFLPVLQGVLFLFAGAALVSLASRRLHTALRSLFGRWPRGWRRMEKLRRALHRRLHRGGEPLATEQPPSAAPSRDEPRSDPTTE